MKRIFITGAGRGIGLAIAREYLGRGDRVLAGCRALERAPALRQLLEQYGDRLSVIPLEVTDVASVDDAVRRVGAEVDGLEVLINNAAINPGDTTIPRPSGQALLDSARALEMLRVNAFAPLVVAQAFLALLRAGVNPRIANISSGAGSLTRQLRGGDYSYGASKAALNMLTRTFAFNVRELGVTVVALTPGWVKTDMGGPNARLEPEESARGLATVIEGLTPGDTGRFLDYQGSEVPW